MRRGWGKAVHWLVVVLAAIAVMAPAASAATPGDNFAEPLPLGGALPIKYVGTNAGATKESGEFVGTFAAGHSVWFSWTASVTGWVTVGTCGSPFQNVVGVFSGTDLASLKRISADTPSSGPHCPNEQREYNFRAASGSDYRIAVDGNAFYLPSAPNPVTEGSFVLRIEATPPPPNDDFAAAAPVAGRATEEPNGARFYFATVPGYNWGATKQAGEPNHGGDPGGASVWYAWTAPESGVARISTMATGAAIIGVYKGSALGSLVPVASNPSSGFAIPAVTAGTTYLIAVDGRRDPMTGEVPGFGFHLQIGMMLAAGPGQPTQQPQPQILPPSPTPVPRTILVKRSVDADARSATFVFKSSIPGSRYRCKLDRGRFKPCRSPKTYRHLAGGRHVFKAVAVNAAGVADPTPLVARLTLPKR